MPRTVRSYADASVEHRALRGQQPGEQRPGGDRVLAASADERAPQPPWLGGERAEPALARPVDDRAAAARPARRGADRRAAAAAARRRGRATGAAASSGRRRGRRPERLGAWRGARRRPRRGRRAGGRSARAGGGRRRRRLRPVRGRGARAGPGCGGPRRRGRAPRLARRYVAPSPASRSAASARARAARSASRSARRVATSARASAASRRALARVRAGVGREFGLRAASPRAAASRAAASSGARRASASASARAVRRVGRPSARALRGSRRAPRASASQRHAPVARVRGRARRRASSRVAACAPRSASSSSATGQQRRLVGLGGARGLHVRPRGVEHRQHRVARLALALGHARDGFGGAAPAPARTSRGGQPRRRWRPRCRDAPAHGGAVHGSGSGAGQRLRHRLAARQRRSTSACIGSTARVPSGHISAPRDSARPAGTSKSSWRRSAPRGPARSGARHPSVV